MNFPKITPENAQQVLIEICVRENISSEKIAWMMIYEFCSRNGMKCIFNKTGIEEVVFFIDSVIKENKSLKDTVNYLLQENKTYKNPIDDELNPDTK